MNNKIILVLTEEEFDLIQLHLFQPKTFTYEEADSYWQELLSEWYKEYGFSCSHWKHIENTPNIWVGEVSWLKAALFEDSNTYISDTIEEVSEIIGKDLPVITDELINRIRSAMALPNSTSYSLAKTKEIITFLESYKGEKCFTVSW